ncbi:MAG TPA: M48 family metallopeptidase [Woeseiaceae bacterium]|nr:M48 family metallopeptidase [Woeseiaceae bacterium]
MDFFQAQDRARRATRWLVVAYLLATALIVAAVTVVVAFALHTGGYPGPPEPALLGGTALAATLLIVGATAYKTAALASGGGRVARDMGGTLVSPDTTDPLRRRLRNVVEEMSIASGVPVPEIYVLEEEQGINAFAAGYTPGDAAIAVTRGALETLSRDELQGVIAHEFSHILNGDMRLSIRMMGVLFGIMVIGLIGRMVVRGSLHGRAVSGRRRQAPAVLALGAGLVILGWIGVLIARLVKAAVSRRRESLADASAVQFTRQTAGLAGALKKIGGYEAGSYLRAADPEEVSHMLFSPGARLASLFATHPPLTERIRALDPSFREEDYVRVGFTDQRAAAAAEPASGAQAFAAAAAAPVAGRRSDSIAASMGRPDASQVALAQSLRASLPPTLYEAAHSTTDAPLLACALALDRSGRHVPRQLALLEQQLGARRRARVEEHHAALEEIGLPYHLPLLEIAFPALKRRPPEQVEWLLDLVRRLVEIDGELELYEYCLYRVLAASLRQAFDPAGRPRPVSRAAVRRAAVELVRIVAVHGNPEPHARSAAFAAGLAALGGKAPAAALDEAPATPADLDRCLDVLAGLGPRGRRTLVEAVAATVSHDGALTLAESELLRAICATLDCPLPPLAVDSLRG